MAKRATKKTAKKAAARKGTGRKGSAKRARTAARKTGRTSAPSKRAPKRAAAKKSAARRPARTSTARPSATKTARKKVAARSTAARQASRQTRPKEPSRIAAAATAVRGTVAKAVNAVTGALPWGGSEPDAIEILERDHRRFEEMLRKGEETTEQARSTRRELLASLTRDLNAHELMEEKVFYPALQSHPQARAIVLEGFQEHHVADVIVSELEQVATNDEQWAARFKVLKENLEHHIQEEEGAMFRTARGIFSKDELRALGQRMLEVRSR